MGIIIKRGSHISITNFKTYYIAHDNQISKFINIYDMLNIIIYWKKKI